MLIDPATYPQIQQSTERTMKESKEFLLKFPNDALQDRALLSCWLYFYWAYFSCNVCNCVLKSITWPDTSRPEEDNND